MRALLVLCLLAGCGTALRDRHYDIEKTIAKAKEYGAYRCKPKELAMAESHADFAKTELDSGHYFKALDEINLSYENAQKAVAIDPAVCAPGKVPAIKKKVILDSDGDGIMDPDDKCKDEPEDKDGYQDEDGCPDPDNDSDGILDKADKCPMDPEDKDGFEDEDGCPD